MTNQEQDSTTQRSATRAPVDRPIHLQFDDSMDVVEGVCRNISIGGMFVRVEKTRPRGSLVRFELEVGESSTIRGLGEVVWSRTQPAGAEREAGIGIKFRFLEQRDRQLIFKLVSQHIKERLARRQTPGEAPPAEPPPPIESPSPVEPLPAEPPPAEPLSAEPPPAEAPAVVPPSAVAPSAEETPFAPAAVPSPELTAGANDPFPELSHEPLPAFDPASIDLGAATEDAPPVGEAPAEEEPVASLFDPAPGDAEPERPVVEEPTPEPSWEPSPETGALPSENVPAAASFLDPLTEPAVAPEARLEPGEVREEPQEEIYEATYEEETVASRNRRSPALLVLAIGFVALAAGLYLLRDRLFGTSETNLPAAVNVAGAAADVEPPLDPPGAGIEPTGIEPTGIEPTEPADAEPAEAEPTEPADVEPADVEPAVASPSPAPPSPAPPEPTPAAELTRLVEIEWSAVPGGLEVVLVADGSIPAARFRHFRLGGSPPREVIQLIGVEEPFARTAYAVDGPGVEQIRTGYHAKPGGNELHVVLDLAGSEVSVSEIESRGRRLRIRVSVP